MSQDCTQESFLRDVATHAMEVLRDDGIYRHLRFKRPTSYCYGFDIVTYPGYLVMSGDMGSWVFSRLHDMFEFFRCRPKNEDPAKLHINRSYWAEKLQAINRGGVKEFSYIKFEALVRQALEDWRKERQDDLHDAAPPFAVPEDLQELVDDLLRAGLDGEVWAHAALRDFEDHEKRLQLTDTFEWDMTEYTYHFVWGCYAIAWAIKQYDDATVKTPEVAAG